MVAIVNHNANLVERVSYDAYGNARHHRAADLDGDGVVDSSDLLILNANWGNYGVGDLNRDGVVDSSDLLILQANWGGALVAGHISQTDNIIGYAGYIFNAELVSAGSTGLYTVRHRHYAPDLGRWLSRDPLGYVDGMSLYEYVRGRVIIASDPRGLDLILPDLDDPLKIFPDESTQPSEEDEECDLCEHNCPQNKCDAWVLEIQRVVSGGALVSGVGVNARLKASSDCCMSRYTRVYQFAGGGGGQTAGVSVSIGKSHAFTTACISWEDHAGRGHVSGGSIDLVIGFGYLYITTPQTSVHLWGISWGVGGGLFTSAGMWRFF